MEAPSLEFCSLSLSIIIALQFASHIVLLLISYDFPSNLQTLPFERKAFTSVNIFVSGKLGVAVHGSAVAHIANRKMSVGAKKAMEREIEPTVDANTFPLL